MTTSFSTAILPCTMPRSDPQTVACITLSKASLFVSSPGFCTSPTLTERTPSKITAFICFPPFQDSLPVTLSPYPSRPVPTGRPLPQIDLPDLLIVNKTSGFALQHDLTLS